MALPQTASAAQLMQACAANGLADLDHSALVQALELMAADPLCAGLKRGKNAGTLRVRIPR